MIMKNQLLNLKMIALMCLMMVLGGVKVWAETFDFKVDHKISESKPYTEGDVTFTFTKGTNHSLFFQKKDPSLRLYGGATMTISVPEGGEISSIALTYWREQNINKVTANVGSYSSNEITKSYKTSKWTGAASSVIFKVGGTYNGKTVEEEKEVIVNQYMSPQGVVQYDAGNWTKEEIEELKKQRLYNINKEKTYNDISLIEVFLYVFYYSNDY